MYTHIHFNLIRLPYKSNNIPLVMFYSAISAEILRRCKTTNELQDSTKTAKILIGGVIKKGTT